MNIENCGLNEFTVSDVWNVAILENGRKFVLKIQFLNKIRKMFVTSKLCHRSQKDNFACD
jgi:hypothetical protein